MSDEYEVIISRLNQIMGRNLAQETLVKIILGDLALQSGDWRELIELTQMKAEFTIENLSWDGPEAKTIKTEAMSVLREGMDDLRDALLRRDQRTPPPSSQD